MAPDLIEPYDVYAQHVRGRKVIYLDLSTWIELRDTQNNETRECLAACRALKNQSRVIFPLSYACRGEVLKQRRKILEKTIVLMDELSEGVAYRLPVFLWKHESDAALPVLWDQTARELSPTILYTYVGYLQERVWRDLYIRPLLALFPEEHRELGLRYLRRQMVPYVSSLQGGLEIASEEGVTDAHDFTCYKPKVIRVAHGTNALKRQLKHERARMFDETIQHIYGGQPGAIPPIGDVSPTVISRFVAAMPSRAVMAETRARWVITPTKNELHDFWDLDHVSQGGAYADVFVTEERKFAGIMRNSKPAVRATVLRGCKELLGWLQDTFGAESQRGNHRDQR